MGRIVEISTPGLSLRKERGFLVIRKQDETIGRVPLDDIDAVIAATPGLYWSGNVLAALAGLSVPVVLAGRNYAPVAHVLPLACHHAQGDIMVSGACPPSFARNCDLPCSSFVDFTRRKRGWARDYKLSTIWTQEGTTVFLWRFWRGRQGGGGGLMM